MLISAKELATLPDYMIERIVDAVRRDMRHEEERAATDKEWADVHKQYARQDRDLLQALNPKTIRRREPPRENLGSIQPKALVPAVILPVEVVFSLRKVA